MALWKVWLRYGCPWWPGVPSIGQYTDADCAIALAFGRISWKDEDLSAVHWLRAGCLSDLEAYQYIAAMDMGWIGVPNKELGRTVELLCWDFGGPLFLQWEVALEVNQKLWGDRVVPLWPPETGYYDTEKVLRDAIAGMEARGCTTPILVAHDYQIARAALQLKRLLGRSPILIPYSTGVGGMTFGSRSFEPDSVQPWTRSLGRWLPREVVARTYCLITGRV